MTRILIFLIFLNVVAFTSKGMNDVYELDKLSTDSLLKRGKADVVKNNYDEALVCFTIAAKRYSSNLDKEEKYTIMGANVGKWYVYFFVYYDYVNAFKAISAAEKISNEIGVSNSKILLDYGCMYQTLSEQSDDPELLHKAFDYYIESIKSGLANDKDLSWVNMSFSNLIQLGASMNQIDRIKPYWEKVIARNKEINNNSPTLTFNKIFYRVIYKMHERNFSGAIEDLNGSEMKNAVNQEGMGRYEVVRLINLAKAYIAHTGNYSDALVCLRQAEAAVDSMGMKDASLEVYKHLRDVYKDSGMRDNYLQYQYKYLSLKDSIINYRSGASISEISYLKKIEDVENKLDSIDRNRRILRNIVWIAVAVIIITLISAVLLRRHNKNLRNLNETLYRNNLLLIEKEETTRKKLEDTLNERISLEKPTVKYNRSDLSENEKEDIYVSVMNVMLNSPDVFEPEFSSAHLSELTGYTYRHISQVINEKTQDNFNALVNDTRIKEACRNMQPGGKFSNLTIEAIAKSVGFRSRTSFIAAFKKFTGMTPSVYLKIANERLNNKNPDDQRSAMSVHNHERSNL